MNGFDPLWVYFGTRDGLRRGRLDDRGLTIESAELHGNVVRAIARHPTDPTDVFIGCGLRGWGLHHSADAGETVSPAGFDDRWVWGVTRHPVDPSTVYVGTEPPMVFRSTDSGASFEPLVGCTSVSSRDGWTFFHEPFFAGHIHAIAIHPDRPDRILAGVEHGGVIRSTDGGDTWADTRPGTDAHRIGFDPADADRVLLAAGAGMFESTDGGVTWSAVDDLRGKYLHTVAFAPLEPATVASYADTASEPVLVSDDGGQRWSAVGDELPASGPADTVRFHPTDPTTLIYAGEVEEGYSQLYVSSDLGATWRPVGERLPKVWRLDVVLPP